MAECLLVGHDTGVIDTDKNLTIFSVTWHNVAMKQPVKACGWCQPPWLGLWKLASYQPKKNFDD